MSTLQLFLEIGPEADPEAVDDATRRLLSELREAGVAADLPRGAPPAGAKSGEAAIVGALGLTMPPEQLPALAALISQWAARTPGRLARFVYQEGDRRVEIEYDPEKTNPRELLAELTRAQATVQINAGGDVTIGGDVAGRDHLTH